MRADLRSLLFFAALLASMSLSVQAQTEPTPEPTPPQNESTKKADDNEEEGRPHLWVARMMSGNYIVRVDRIASIGKHEYIANGATRVIEVTVTTNSSAIARFYYLEVATGSTSSAAKEALNKMQSLAKEAGHHAGNEEVLFEVTKDYPNTTHAHTIEFRLRSEDAVNSLYSNLARTMETGKGRRYNEPSK